jgi:hypothetical protein
LSWCWVLHPIESVSIGSREVHVVAVEAGCYNKELQMCAREE